MTNLRGRIERLESVSAGLLLVCWRLDGAGRTIACGLTQADDESREQFLARAAAGRGGVLWVSELDAAL